VLHEAERGHLRQSQAGAQLKLSGRWVRKLVARLRKEGDGEILHRLRGRAAKRKIPEAVRRKAVERESRDFGPTLTAEYLAEKHRLRVSQATLRPCLIEAGVWQRQRRRVETQASHADSQEIHLRLSASSASAEKAEPARFSSAKNRMDTSAPTAQGCR